MPLFTKSPGQEVRSSARFHAYQSNAQISREMQKLLAGKLLPHHHFALHAGPNHVENCLPDIDADSVYLHRTPPV
jgi:hypothetical protein